MSELPGNSRHGNKTEITVNLDEENLEKLREFADEQDESRAERVVFNKVVERKPNIGDKLVDLFSGVFKGLASDVLIPALKETARDFVTQGIERALYRDDEPRRSSRHHSSRVGSNIGRTNYNGVSRSSRDDRDDRRDRRGRHETVDLEDVILEKYVEAEALIDEMYRILKKYGVVTVGDVNFALGQDELTTPGDNNRGWFDLHGLRYKKIREGYLMQFPEVDDIPRRR